ncbi:MAG: prevent-host-death family protein [Gammaproteobacteria bacterium]|nr:MAG: prevent-host-death family protein [Gammaproteobacteria bacterium]
METFRSKDRQNRFGDLLMKAQIEPVCIKRYNKSTAYMLSASGLEEFQEYKLHVLCEKIAKGINSLEKGDLLDGDKVFDELMELANG